MFLSPSIDLAMASMSLALHSSLCPLGVPEFLDAWHPGHPTVKPCVCPNHHGIFKVSLVRPPQSALSLALALLLRDLKTKPLGIASSPSPVRHHGTPTMASTAGRLHLSGRRMIDLDLFTPCGVPTKISLLRSLTPGQKPSAYLGGLFPLCIICVFWSHI